MTADPYDLMADVARNIETDMWRALSSELMDVNKKLRDYAEKSWDLHSWFTPPRDPETVGKKPLATAIRQTIGNTKINAIGQELPSIDWQKIVEMEKILADSIFYSPPIKGSRELFNDLYMCRFEPEPKPPSKMSYFSNWWSQGVLNKGNSIIGIDNP